MKIPKSKILKSDQSQQPSDPEETAKANPEAEELANPPALLPTPNELVELLSKRVIGHEQAKRSISVAVYQHLINCAKSDTTGGRVEAENHVLLVGPTGSGKSLLFRTLGDVLKIPIFYVPCTNIAPHGYKGKDLAQHLESIADVIVDSSFTRPAIVVWDEVDKLSLYNNNDSVAAIYKRMTQMDFLTYLDGTKCGNENQMDSSRILNISCGAFPGLCKIRKPKPKPVMGFHAGDLSGNEILQPLCPEHLIRYGLIAEFVGRFARLAELDPLDRKVLRKILTDAEGNVLALRKEFYAVHGIRLEVTDDAIDEIVKKSLTHGTGARSLRLVVDQVFRPIEHKLPDMAEEGVTALVIDKNAVLGISEPIEHKDISPKPNRTLLELRHIALYSGKPSKRASESTDVSIF